jgi:hypothetical protein
MRKLESDLSLIGFSEQLTPVLRPGDRSANDLYVGTIAIPQLDRRIHAYVKICPPSVRGQSAYNEVIAHHLSTQCSLSTPLTLLCACRPAQLRSATRDRMAGDSSEFVTGVASLDVAVRGIRQALPNSDAAVAEVMTWPEVARLAVFDELVANDDRHLENLIRQGPAKYIPVDNERILFGEPWFNMDLASFAGRACEANVLAATIAEGPDQIMRQRMARIAQQLILGTLFAVPAGADALEQRCSAPAGATCRLIDMLNIRRLKLLTLMQWHFKKGDLFQESFKK